MPFRSEERADGHAVELAYLAACASTPAIGIGLDARGTVCLHYAKLDPSCPLLLHEHVLLHEHPSRAGMAFRRFGSDAARVAKGMPLKPTPPMTEPASAARRIHQKEGTHSS